MATHDGKRFFRLDDHGCDWSIVARDLAHAKLIIATQNHLTGCLVEPGSADYERPPTWSEIENEQASVIMTTDEANPPTRMPLSERSLGDFYSSEW